MGRAERRAAERGRGAKTLAGFQLMLTPDEAALVEEALISHRRVMRAEMGDPSTYSDLSKWSYERAEQLRLHLRSSLDGWAYQSPAGVRSEPVIPPADGKIDVQSSVREYQKAMKF